MPKIAQIENLALKWGQTLRFSLAKLHMTERLESLNEVCEGVAGVKNHTKKCCWP